ncbi:MAG TPA: flavodoxin domain-containing protein [Pseudolabrys sp.]|uniref:diflavin oxidoreductase n=1 Tax=Pseudolabrys sp. TaxID=1960880 RepID=UPI002DDCF5A9|nr:flavodoxin domain-containing protein [Pseudolabrys sp.]HEV2630749.1 flavodoxin domain-containing protein [Pseudolabrys sp.]
MSAFAAIPKTAPFSEEDVDLLNRVVGPASQVQRAWLAGFLAGVEAAQGGGEAAIEQAAPRAAEPLTIVYASESGNSEKLAGDMAKSARKLGFKPAVVDMADLELASLTKAKRLVVIAATWGEGEPPGRAARVYNELMGEGAPRLDGVEFGVLALGDTAYAEFCAIGKRIDERLEALGGKRVADRVDCDLDFAAPAAQWVDGTLKALAPADLGKAKVISVDFGGKQTASPNTDIVEAEVTEHVNLNSSRSAKETIHLALGFDNGAPAYEPGASLDLYPENDSAYVDELLTLAGVHDDALRQEFITSRDVTTLSVKTIETYAASTGHQYVKQLIADGHARDWTNGRQLIDLFGTFPISLDAERLRALTRPLAPRAYSIASSRKDVGDEAHLLVSAVRYASHGRDRRGVASNFVAERLKKGGRIRVKLKPNKHFGLPAGDRDIIMVGPGTGVAPFRAFVQERRAVGATGKNWLFFGDRSYTHDFLYQLDWQDALKDGALTRMDLAFSRDRPDKVYVQHRIWERRKDLIDWLENGANFYVCGDAKSMAKDVRAMLVNAYADVKTLSADGAEQAVAALERDKRYLQDVY